MPDSGCMRLSAEIYDQIVAALKSDSQKDLDNRLEPRVGMAGEATLVTVREDGRQVTARVRVRDVSRSGIGLYYSSRFVKDQRLIIQLQKASGESIWLVCIAAYCRRVEPDRYSVGVRIRQVLRPEQVQQVESRLARGRRKLCWILQSH